MFTWHVYKLCAHSVLPGVFFEQTYCSLQLQPATLYVRDFVFELTSNTTKQKTDDRIFAHFSPSNFMLQNCCAAAFVLVSIQNSTRMKLHAFILVLDVF